MSDRTEQIVMAVAVIFSIAAIIMAAVALSRASKKCDVTAGVGQLPNVGQQFGAALTEAEKALAAQKAALATASTQPRKEGFYYYNQCSGGKKWNAQLGLCA